ncbi:hypothetical protein [Micromonospora inositola]|uniref:hypothetical protein n=1 Tax=Micromonospora inositola TaxID=47865 RepID=UPI000B5AF955|nr:hypothetical protein [Micromonospora inositola]
MGRRPEVDLAVHVAARLGVLAIVGALRPRSACPPAHAAAWADEYVRSRNADALAAFVPRDGR